MAILYLIPAGLATAQPACPNATLRSGASASLPDCRAYEQVSPAEKRGYEAVPLPIELVGGNYLQQAAPNGEAFFYEDKGVFGGASGDPTIAVPHMARRTENGWQTAELAPPSPQVGTDGGFIVEAFPSEELSELVLDVPEEPLAPGYTPGAYNLFAAPTEQDGAYRLINAAKPTQLPAEECQPPRETCFLEDDRVAFAGASHDFAHVIFETDAQYGASSPSTGTLALYESFEGTVRLVGVLPDGAAAQNGSTAGSGSSFSFAHDGRLEYAISESGQRIVFEAEGEPGSPQEGDTEVYDRIEGQDTIELSAPQGAPPGAIPASARFWAASANGAHVFFTSSAELTSTANTGEADDSEDLYEYDLEDQALRDLSVDTDPEDQTNGARVLGVLGASADGGYVYFVAEGLLADNAGADGERAIDGAPNLYLVHDGGSPTFIATLSVADARDWSERSAGREAPESYLAPNGLHLALMSAARLPTARFPAGYDNVDEATGEADSEVYEYDAPSAQEEAAGGAGTLACASCDPSGAPPSGAPPRGDALIGGLVVNEVQAKVFQVEGFDAPFHHARTLSESGARLFFSSTEALTASPVGAPSAYRKVYEYEQDGAGSCEITGGCIFLLSSAATPSEDVLLDASDEGEDVFFATKSQLAPSDDDGLTDIYDAREDGGFAEAPSPAPCQTGCRALGAGLLPGPPLITRIAGASGNLPVTTSHAPPPERRAKCHAAPHARHDKSRRAKLRCTIGKHDRRGALAKHERRARQERRGHGR